MHKLVIFLSALLIVITPSLANDISTANLPLPSVTSISEQAATGDAAAQHQLALLYSNGQGVKKSKKKARDWFVKAASQGYVESKYELGKLYSTGRLKEAAYVVGANWFKEAANENHDKAQYALGMLYNDGKGVERNPELALAWFAKSAKLGNPDAQLKMASSTAMPQIKLRGLPRLLNKVMLEPKKAWVIYILPVIWSEKTTSSR